MVLYDGEKQNVMVEDENKSVGRATLRVDTYRSRNVIAVAQKIAPPQLEETSRGQPNLLFGVAKMEV